MRKKLLLLLGLAIATSTQANDCVPLTFTTLSKMVGEKRSYADWRRLVMQDGHPPLIMDAVRTWNDEQERSRLYCIYSVLPQIVFKDEAIVHDLPYFWIGLPHKDMVEPGDSPGAHAAIVIFKDDRISIIHTVDRKSKIEERVTFDELMRRTLCLFRVDRLVEFAHFETIGEVIIIHRRN